MNTDDNFYRRNVTLLSNSDGTILYYIHKNQFPLNSNTIYKFSVKNSITEVLIQFNDNVNNAITSFVMSNNRNLYILNKIGELSLIKLTNNGLFHSILLLKTIPFALNIHLDFNHNIYVMYSNSIGIYNSNFKQYSFQNNHKNVSLNINQNDLIDFTIINNNIYTLNKYNQINLIHLK